MNGCCNTNVNGHGAREQNGVTVNVQDARAAQAATEGAAAGVTATAQAERGSRATFLAPVDVYETGQEIVVVADVPGARADDVDVRYEDGTLTIRAGVGRGTRGGRTLLNEYGVGDYARTLRFGQWLDVASATAELTAGVLTLRLPKAEQARARKIRVGGE